MTANPSIERTSSSMLRTLPAAAHVQREASRLSSCGNSMTRRALAIFLLATLIAGCGGGDSEASPGLSVKVSGQQVAAIPVGESANVTVQVGRSLEIHSTSIVSWVEVVNNNSGGGFGHTFSVGGATVHNTSTAYPSKVWSADTSAESPLSSPVSFSVSNPSTPPTTVVVTLTN